MKQFGVQAGHIVTPTRTTAETTRVVVSVSSAATSMTTTKKTVRTFHAEAKIRGSFRRHQNVVVFSAAFDAFARTHTHHCWYN